MTFRVLVTDEIDPEGVAILAAEPKITVDEVPTLPKEDLLARIGDYDAIIGRSATRISADLLQKGRKLIEEALAVSREAGIKREIAWNLSLLGGD